MLPHLLPNAFQPLPRRLRHQAILAHTRIGAARMMGHLRADLPPARRALLVLCAAFLLLLPPVMVMATGITFLPTFLATWALVGGGLGFVAFHRGRAHVLAQARAELLRLYTEAGDTLSTHLDGPTLWLTLWPTHGPTPYSLAFTAIVSSPEGSLSFEHVYPQAAQRITQVLAEAQMPLYETAPTTLMVTRFDPATERSSAHARLAAAQALGLAPSDPIGQPR